MKAAEFKEIVPFGPFELEVDGNVVASGVVADFQNLTIPLGRENMESLFFAEQVVVIFSDLQRRRVILKTTSPSAMETSSTRKTWPPQEDSLGASGSPSFGWSPSRSTNRIPSEMVFVDTETTGFSPYSDEVIEIAAIRVREFEEVKRFQSFLIPNGPVRAVHIHGYTRSFLLAHGRPQPEVFEEFCDFVGETLVAGHNVNYDVGMLEANSRRNSVDLRLRIGYDTLTHSRSVLFARSYRLERLTEMLNLGKGMRRCHNALDDVLLTIELAKLLCRGPLK